MAGSSRDGRGVQELLLEKQLSSNDVKRLYVPKQRVQTILRAALNGEGPNANKLLVHDSVLNHWQFQLSETTGGRIYITGDWKRFVDENNLKEGDIIRFFKIGRVRLFGVLID